MQLEYLIARPSERRYDPPILLLHGAWHGAWCWERAMPDLAARGFEVHAISLRGHGNSDRPRNHALTNPIAYGHDLITTVSAMDRPPILIGHSSGGYLTQLYVTGAFGPVPPLAGAVLLCSSPVDITGYFMRRRQPPDQKVDMRAMLRREPATMRSLLFRPDIDMVDLERHVARMVAEPPMATMGSMLLRPKPARNRTPILVIAGECDKTFGVDAQQMNAQAYGANLIIVPEATHDLMLDPAWPQAAAAIERFAQRL